MTALATAGTDLGSRLAMLLGVLDEHAPAAGDDHDTDVVDALVASLDGASDRVRWLFLAVVHGELPTVDEVRRMRRAALLRGTAVVVREHLDVARARLAARPQRLTIVRDAVLVDVGHTVTVTFTSGIQRVVRETVSRWRRSHEVMPVAWTGGFTALRELRPYEYERLDPDRTHYDEPPGDPADYHLFAEHDTVVVPWGGQYVVPELTAEPDRIDRIQALVSLSGLDTSFLGYDCIPVTSAETVATGMSSNFVRYLAAIRGSGRLTAISEAAADEFRGWARMSAAAGYRLPEIAAITLPVTAAPPVGEEAVRAARAALQVLDLPLLLVVGSHEPRKNHLAVLHAAELLWRDGLRFCLAFVGSGAWKQEQFDARAQGLQRAGRPLAVVSGLPDDALDAAYRIAHCVVFPSLNEGYGLPVAEALSAGTPVITSGFGSTAAIVAPDGVPRGGLLVDPRDDAALRDAMRRVLADPVLWQRLRDEAAQHPTGSWDDYARRTWDFLVGTVASASASAPPPPGPDAAGRAVDVTGGAR